MKDNNLINQRFWKKVQKTNSCWLFTGGLARGYGHFSYEDKPIKAHRFSWIIHFGAIPKNKLVCHKCDIRNCVNPDHLFLGTQRDNIQDMIQKGRINRAGENGHNSRLTQKQVDNLRSLRLSQKLTYQKLGELFGISLMHAYRIVNFIRWKVQPRNT